MIFSSAKLRENFCLAQKPLKAKGVQKVSKKISAMVMIMVVMAVEMMIITVGYEPHHSAILLLVGHDDDADDDDLDDDCDHQCWCLKCILH